MDLKAFQTVQNMISTTIGKKDKYTNKKPMKKFLFDLDQSIDKENVLYQNLENTPKPILNKKNQEQALQKPSQKNQETEQILDFREEIERRFRKSVVNKIYIFPRKQDIEFDSDSSSEASNNSLAEAEVYDLKYQKPKQERPKINEKVQEKKNMSFQDFLSKIQEEKGRIRPHSFIKQNIDETSKKNIKGGLNQSQGNYNNKSGLERMEEIGNLVQKEKGSFSMTKRPTEEKSKVKMVKGRKVINESNVPQKGRMNASGPNSKRKEISNTSNIFHTINSIINVYGKPKKKENSFQEFLQRKCNKKNISELLFQNAAISNALKIEKNNLASNPLYYKAKNQLLKEKEGNSLYRSVEGLNSLKEKVLTESYVSPNSPKSQKKMGTASDENRCRKERPQKETNLQKSYDLSKNSFKDFLMEHSQEQESNHRTDRMILLQNYLKENKDRLSQKV